MGFSDVQLVGVSHQEPHLLETVLRETQDVYSELVIVVVTQNVKVLALLVKGDFPDHSDVPEDVHVYLRLFAFILEIQID